MNKPTFFSAVKIDKSNLNSKNRIKRSKSSGRIQNDDFKIIKLIRKYENSDCDLDSSVEDLDLFAKFLKEKRESREQDDLELKNRIHLIIRSTYKFYKMPSIAPDWVKQVSNVNRKNKSEHYGWTGALLYMYGYNNLKYIG